MFFASLLFISLPRFSSSAPLLPRDQALFTAGRVASSTSAVHPSPSAIFFSPESAPSPRPIVAAYYPDWTASQIPPELVDFDRLDWVDFAFAVPDHSSFTPTFLQDDSEALLTRLVAAAHAKNKKVKLSVGGWTGSGHFSDAVNPENRQKFVNAIAILYHKFNLDGIDIDWEYPGEPGAPGNTFAPADAADFLAFIKLLRACLPNRAYITAATQVWPFMDANGNKMADVSPFARVLDWVLLMNYDIWGSSPNPGANAPLSDACHNSTQPEANAHAAIQSWTAAGFPARKIMLGLPAYGYVSRSGATTLRTRRRTPILPVDLGSGPAPPTDVTATSESGSAEAGQVQFRALVTQGVLRRTAPGTFVGAGGFAREWDACSSTPFLRSADARQIVTYDDPESLGMKAAFANQAGILGINMWDAHGDTLQWDLVDAIRRGLGVD